MASTTQSRFDPHFTQHVIDSIGPKTTPRTRQVMGALIKHVHDFAREVELTIDEWMLGVNFMNAVGQISDSKRNEGHRICDVIGLETLVDEIAHKLMTESDDIPTSSSILGPFWSPNAPFRENGESIIMSPHKGGYVSLMHGRVTDYATKKPLVGAVFDIWQASTNGKYDFQDPENQEDNNLRGKFRTNEKGEYFFYCLKPTPYSLPVDGPAGVLLNLLDRHPMRPAHIHLMVSHADYRPTTTQIFPKDDPYLTSDTVFAVKDDLVVEFKPLEGDPKATLVLEYNVSLVPKNFEGLPQKAAAATTNGSAEKEATHGAATNGTVSMVETTIAAHTNGTGTKTENTSEAATIHATPAEAPATEASHTEVPTTEAPVTEAPVTEAPATKAPATEAPITEAPKSEAPITEAPTAEAPTTEAPTTEAPTTELPTTELPAAPAAVAPGEIPVSEFLKSDIPAPVTHAAHSTETAPTEAPPATLTSTEAPTTETV